MYTLHVFIYTYMLPLLLYSEITARGRQAILCFGNELRSPNAELGFFFIFRGLDPSNLPTKRARIVHYKRRQSNFTLIFPRWKVPLNQKLFFAVLIYNINNNLILGKCCKYA
jgi:hypothetical protein